MRNTLAIIIISFILGGCTTTTKPTVRIINDVAYGNYKESELVSIAGRSDGDILVNISRVNGKNLSPGLLDTYPDIIKVPPGRHNLELYCFEPSLSLNSRGISFHKNLTLDVVKGHSYEIFMRVDKTLAQELLGGGTVQGWVEDLTTGKKVSIL